MHTVQMSDFHDCTVTKELAASSKDQKTLTLIFSPYFNEILYRVVARKANYMAGFATLAEAIEDYNSF